MADIFIAYRREDSSDISGRVYDRLVALYGARHVFKDVISLQGGQRFPAKLENAITEHTIMLVIIGQRWLPIIQERHDDPYDFGRIEIEIALRQRATIIPVLVQGARMPSQEELPPVIADLANFHAINVRSDPDFTSDIDQVRRAVGLYVRSSPRSIPWLAMMSIFLLIALGAGLVWHFGSPGQPAASIPPIQCLDAHGNYPDKFIATGTQHAFPLAKTAGISGQRIVITGSASTESAIANARIYFDPDNNTCTLMDYSRPGTVRGYFHFINDTKNSYQMEVSDFSLTEVPNLPYNPSTLNAYELGVIPNIVIVNQHIYSFIKNLSRQNLRDIFTGKITYWSQVDSAAPAEPINTVWTGDSQTLAAGWPDLTNLDSLYTLSGPLVSFKRDVLGNDITASRPTRSIATGQLDVLKTVQQDPDAISFVSLPSPAFYDQTYGDHFKETDPYVTINNYSPASVTDVESNNYPFWNIAYAYTKTSLDGTQQGKAALALIRDISLNSSFKNTDIPELDWFTLDDFSSVQLDCHVTKDPCN